LGAIGGKIGYTSKEALQRFVDGATAAADRAPVSAGVSAEEEQDWRETNEELDREGL
tara:strand:+ start:127 stop:297 length:171 start_codon:yes stop_codon:yes gene_type:complete